MGGMGGGVGGGGGTIMEMQETDMDEEEAAQDAAVTIAAVRVRQWLEDNKSAPPVVDRDRQAAPLADALSIFTTALHLVSSDGMAPGTALYGRCHAGVGAALVAAARRGCQVEGVWLEPVEQTAKARLLLRKYFPEEEAAARIGMWGGAGGEEKGGGGGGEVVDYQNSMELLPEGVGPVGSLEDIADQAVAAGGSKSFHDAWSLFHFDRSELTGGHLADQALDSLDTALAMGTKASASPTDGGADLRYAAEAAMHSLEVIGNTDPAAAAKMLCMYQGLEARECMKDVYGRALTEANRESLFLSLNGFLGGTHLGGPTGVARTNGGGALHIRDAPRGAASEGYLKRRSKAMQRLSCETPIDTILADLPTDVRVLVLQETKDGSAIYAAVVSRCAPPSDGGGEGDGGDGGDGASGDGGGQSSHEAWRSGMAVAKRTLEPAEVAEFITIRRDFAAWKKKASSTVMRRSSDYGEADDFADNGPEGDFGTTAGTAGASRGGTASSRGASRATQRRPRPTFDTMDDQVRFTSPFFPFFLSTLQLFSFFCSSIILPCTKRRGSALPCF